MICQVRAHVWHRRKKKSLWPGGREMSSSLVLWLTSCVTLDQSLSPSAQPLVSSRTVTRIERYQALW